MMIRETWWTTATLLLFGWKTLRRTKNISPFLQWKWVDIKKYEVVVVVISVKRQHTSALLLFFADNPTLLLFADDEEREMGFIRNITIPFLSRPKSGNNDDNPDWQEHTHTHRRTC